MTDSKLIMSAGQVVTVTVASTDVLDLGALVNDRGVALSEFGPEGDKIRLVVILPTVTTKTGTSIEFTLQDSPDGATFANADISRLVPAAAMVAGYEALNVSLPPAVKRYIRMNYVVSGADFDITVDSRLRQGATS